ncbi:hypothetical protein [Paenibacillus sp. NEAU-GSW1]|uniref:XkdQ/YqbQ family protein n=1 Tax=Paenibacillus sp. NEAU-GSW1 TaxID=2682486 RepID=UPI0012E1909F|nr:hypothetical protein [Paenibacillus sp. NEAU-GSW1]MUT67825.1 hypothetical protein [Paenibacillus sp. NEAU-GSW1]
MLEIILDNRDGKMWDITSIVPSLTYKTKRIGAASSLDLTIIKTAPYQHSAFSVNNGDVIRVRMDKHNVFYGYVFEVGRGQDETLTVKAYDQIRYLLGNDTYVFKNKTASEIVKKIAGDLGMKTGKIANTGYVIPSMIEDNKKLLDIVCKALDLTLINGKGNYMLFDDFGVLSVQKLDDRKVDVAIGDWSLMYGFDYKSSIDSDTFNRVKIVKDNKETGKREVYLAQDSAKIARWGRLQHYQQANENMNSAQINEQLDQLMKLKNREQRSLSIQAVGDMRIRAGCYVPILIEELGLKQYFLVEECSHSLDADMHTMKLELKVI